MSSKANYTADDVALTEQLEILIKACWRAYATRGTIPATVWTCIKLYLAEAPYLVPIYGALFATSDKELVTGLDLQNYILTNLR